MAGQIGLAKHNMRSSTRCFHAAGSTLVHNTRTLKLPTGFRHKALQQVSRRARLYCATPDHSRDIGSTGADESISDYIKNNCPAPGINGQYREQATDPTFEAVCLTQNSEQYLCPGSRLSVPLSNTVMEQVMQQSQVVLAHFEDSNGLLVPSVSARGSTAVLAQVVGVQRLGDTVLASLRVQERIVVQAVSSSQSSGLILVRAAPLVDRWVYCVRASAVAQLAADSTGRSNPEVSTALANLQDVQLDLHVLIQELGALTAKFTQDPHNEWQDLLSWVSGATDVMRVSPPPSPEPSSDAEPRITPDISPDEFLQRATRLSYAMFAASATPLLLGITEEDLRARRSQAMAQTDIGKRSEDGVEFAELLRNLLCAKLALGGV